MSLVSFVKLDRWVREFELYRSLCQVRFFRQFRLTKTFLTWKGVVRRQRFRDRTRMLTENSCLFGNRL